MVSPRERFARIGRHLSAIEEEDLREAAEQDPGEKLLRSLRWSDVWLADHLRRLEEDPALAAAEEESALHKADLHLRGKAPRGGT